MLLPSRKQCQIIVGPSHLLVQIQNTVHSIPLTTSRNTAKLMSDIEEHLLSFQSELKASPVRVILANHFVRYTTLDWREGITKTSDWHAIAENHLRKVYGQKAALLDWQVEEQGYGNPLLVAATDKIIIEQFDYLAKRQQWRLQSVQPAFMSVANHFSSQLKGDTWLMIAEPEHLLLAKAGDGCWQGFTVSLPPAGEENIQARSMINQALQGQPNAALKRCAIYGDSNLTSDIAASNLEVVFLKSPRTVEYEEDMGYGYLR